MLKFSASLSMLFQEWPLEDRFQAAKDAGFDAVEIQLPYSVNPDRLARAREAADVRVVLINAPKDFDDQIAFGRAAIPDAHLCFADDLNRAFDYAHALQSKRIHILAGLIASNDKRARETYLNALNTAATRATNHDIDIVIEPLNTRDAPGYFLNSYTQAIELLKELNLPNVKLLFDIYHRQILHGDVMTALSDLQHHIGHVQIASVPHRHEPGTGELDDFAVLRHLDALGYSDYVGCEYRPIDGTLAGLGWRERWTLT